MENYKFRQITIDLLPEYQNISLKDVKKQIDELIRKYGSDAELRHEPGYDGCNAFELEIKVPAKCVCDDHIHVGKNDCRRANCPCYTAPPI